ncbi:acyltransferase family protein [Tabrizicola flagellatus]|uniref:acyltransferase family protein n=1 Tax=Tabrizicola flagellatus TaxID=2593021 RepID=UPI00135AB692|nr:acyltransferase [Tabrizicola flagellatus]
MIGGLQMLRGVAATLVVLFHLQAAAVAEGQDPGLLRWFHGGEAGVDAFFVLSGFVIFHAAMGRQDRGAAWFLRQRFWRIMPPYWAALGLTLMAMAGLAILRGDWSAWPDGWSLVVSVLLLPLPDQVMAVAWTLTVEGLFYLVFAASFFRFGARGAMLALIGWALVTQGLKLAQVPLPGWLGLILYSGVVEFLFGGLIALALAAGWRRGAGLAVLSGALGLAAVVTGLLPLAWGREWVAGLPSAALVYGLAAGGWRMPGWTLVWGEASYLLYLLHLLVFSVAGTLLRMAGVAPYGSLVPMLALGVLATAVSVAATLWVERPYRAWAKRH